MEFRIESIRERVRVVDDEERVEAERALRALTRPRLTGTAGAVETEAELRRRFESLGYEIRELPFRISTWPGRYGVPAVGVVYLVGLATAAARLGTGNPYAAAAALLGTAALIGLCALLAPRALAGFPLGRVDTANWLVVRPAARPRYLVVAHRDSKSQPISTYLRTAAITVAGLAWIALLALAGIAALAPGWDPVPLVLGVGALGLLGGGLLAACPAGNASPGALDNATGLAALLGIARRERDHDDVGFLVTDAEELGLAGARDAAARFPPLDGIINLDGLDDEGTFHIVERSGWPRRRGHAPHLVAALLASAAALRLPARRRDLPPGVLVDHIPFARAGFPAVSVLHGSARSLRRVHRPDDTADRLGGHGAARAIALVSGALELLRGRPSG